MIPINKIINRTIFYIFFVIIGIIIFLPLLITVFASFKTARQISVDFPLKLPSTPHLKNYITVFQRGDLLTGYLNSLILVVFTLLINSLLGSMAAYCLSRFRFKLRKLFFFLFMLGMIVPIYVTEVARFSVIQALGLYNTRGSAILIYAAADMMQLYIIIQFVKNIPVSIDESALLDGCSYFQIYFRIILPLIVPAIATLATLKSIEVINDMYIPYLYMPKTSLLTMTTSIMRFAGTRYARWEVLSAGIILVMLPTILLYVFFQKFVFKGITAGAVKG
ncbi:MAG: carbohydrate ABC transporter permease [Spirochaetales bacterium]|nr:carbohydrate ABC transporter permease [Spirochaetales bacterium]